MNFENFHVIDNHCHVYSENAIEINSEKLIRIFFHGMSDIPNENFSKPRYWPATDELKHHFNNMSINQALLHSLSKLFNCSCDADTIAEERNQRCAKSFSEYIRFLYDDAKIIATVLDTDLSEDDDQLQLTPDRRLRLFQYEKYLSLYMSEEDSYDDMRSKFMAKLHFDIESGYIGVKIHLAEKIGFDIQPISIETAVNAYGDAKNGDLEAYKKIYVRLFEEVLLECQNLDTTVHLHSGFTGGFWDGVPESANPFLLTSFLKRHDFLQTKIVMLHGGYPWTREVGQMAHALPHIWVDLSQMTPWASLGLADCYRDILAWAPLSKVMLGSGGHDTPEIAWMAAKLGKKALETVMTEAVSRDLFNEEYATHAAELILNKNAKKLYNLE